jgi:4-carboxymuconolactone decarboxylase
MTRNRSANDNLPTLDDATRALVRLSAIVTAGSDDAIRDALAHAVGAVPHQYVEELLLQTYLFAGFPRALNATREWRRLVPEPEHAAASSGAPETWRYEGERTCALVYGPMYERLRRNIRHLHPLLDDWMITEGYGKVLSRPGLDLGRRELCIVAACAAAHQDRQLHSHLHGALNVGVQPSVIDAAIAALADLLGSDRLRSVSMLWARVRGK